MTSPFPPPPDDPRNLPHWAGAREGTLRLQRCTNCGVCRFPAAWQCARCHDTGAEWTTATGHGYIESFCIFHKAYWPAFKDTLPYTVLQVMLDEGVRYMSSLPGSAGPEIAIGRRVRAWFDPVSPEVTLVRFAPLAVQGATGTDGDEDPRD